MENGIPWGCRLDGLRVCRILPGWFARSAGPPLAEPSRVGCCVAHAGRAIGPLQAANGAPDNGGKGYLPMLFLLSPAKALDFETPATDLPHTQPLFTAQSAELIALLRQKSPLQISELMHLSDALSALNVARYQAWSPQFSAHNAKQAVLAFNGDVYGGLNAATLPADALAWTQDHL